MENKKKGGNVVKIIIIVVVAIIVVGAGAFAGYYFLFAKNANQKSNIQSTQVPVVNQTTVSNNTAVNQQGTMMAVISSRTYNLDEFLVNLADEDGKRYIKVKIYVGYENKKMDKEFEEKKAQIRDAVNSVLRSKKAKDFTQKGTEDIKVEILNRINPMMTTGRANSIYFYDILVQ